MLCWWCQSNTYQPYSSKTTKFSLIFEEKRGDGIEGEEYRRRISKRGGGREGGLCRCHRGAARGDPHCRCNLRAIVSQELLFNLEPFKKSWQPS